MTQAEQIAGFAVDSSYEDLSSAAREQLKIHTLDALGCALGALDGEPVRLIREQVAAFGGAPLATLIGGGRTAPDRAAFYNGALVRYLDFNDSYPARNETCHPSDNVAPVLAASEYAAASGRDFLAALAVAYQVQCRLSDAAPVRAKGFDHTTQGSYAVAAGVSRALGLSRERAANAIGICGAAFNALRVTRTGALSNWKGLAYPNTAFGCTHAVFLAMHGITGPLEVFEGKKGFMEAITGRFEIDWSREDLERVTRTALKKYNAEMHAQSSIEGILELQREHRFHGDDIQRIEADVFDVAYNIIGGGQEGDKTVVRTKEQADHSLPYILAAAVLDGELMPEQYRPERIARDDVQRLLRKIVVKPDAQFSWRFPDEAPCLLRVELRDSRVLTKEKRDWEGYATRPMSWSRLLKKFHRLAAPYASEALRAEIVDAVRGLEQIRVADLTRLLGAAGREEAKHA